jgi:hypothetical protein
MSKPIARWMKEKAGQSIRDGKRDEQTKQAVGSMVREAKSY